MAIALFYALGTLIGGVSGPLLFGFLIGSGSQWAVAGGYAGAAALMIGAAICEALLGVEAAGKSLEDVSRPLSSSGLNRFRAYGGCRARPGIKCRV